MSAPCVTARAAAVLNLTDWFTAVGETAAQAGSDFGTDFRVPSGQSLYQVRTLPVGLQYTSGNEIYYEVKVAIDIHHNRSSYADELNFQTVVVNGAFAYLFDRALWVSRSNVYAIAEDGAESDEIEREGDVLTYSFAITLLMDNL